MKVVLSDEKATERAGRAFAQLLQPGDLVGLTGTLGAGKTSFVRGVVAQLAPEARVSSPTYTLMNHYRGEAPVRQILHADLYRLTSYDDLESTGYWDELEQADVALIEWMDQVPDAWAQDGFTVELGHLDAGRTLAIGWKGSKATGTLRMRQLPKLLAEFIP